MPNHPTVRHIIAVVRHAGPKGCTAQYVARISGASIQAVTKALDLQVQAGSMSSSEVWDGERYVGCVYTLREGA